jgi:chromosome segregation ATPase
MGTKVRLILRNHFPYSLFLFLVPRVDHSESIPSLFPIPSLLFGNPMMTKPLISAVVAIAALFTLTYQASADQNGKKNNAQRNDERRENEAVQKARRDVGEAEKGMRDAEQSARKAADKVKELLRDQSKAASQIQRRRDELEKKHADYVGLTEARRTLESTRKVYEQAGAPILKQARESAQYQEAVEAAKQADRRLSSVRDDDDLEESERLKLLSDTAKIKQRPAQLEREALDAEEALKEYRSKLRDAEQAVVKAKTEMEKAVEKDPELKSAKDAFEVAKDRVTAARRDLAKESRDLADARQKLTREQNDLQQKISADQKDDNRGKNKGKK